MRVHSKESGMKRRTGPFKMGVIGGLLVLLMVVAVACGDELQPFVTLESTATLTVPPTPGGILGSTPTLPSPAHRDRKEAADYSEDEIAEIALALNCEFFEAINHQPEPDLERAMATYSSICQPDKEEFAAQVDALLEVFEGKEFSFEVVAATRLPGFDDAVVVLAFALLNRERLSGATRSLLVFEGGRWLDNDCEEGRTMFIGHHQDYAYAGPDSDGSGVTVREMPTPTPSPAPAPALILLNGEPTDPWAEAPDCPAVDGFSRNDIIGVWSSPVVENGILYAGSEDGHLYAINASTGEHLWRFETGGMVASSPRVYRGLVFVHSMDGYLYGVDAGSGTMLSSNQVVFGLTSSPVVGSGAVVVGSDRVYGLNADTGELLWDHYQNDAWGDVATLAAAAGVVYVVT